MKKIVAILTLALIVALSSSCCRTCRATGSKDLNLLSSNAWQVVQLNAKTLKAQGDSYTISFDTESQQLRAMGGCNRIMGGYTMDEKGALSFDRLSSTRMACPDPELEQRFIDALNSTTKFDIDDDMLLLFSGDRLTAVLQAQ